MNGAVVPPYGPAVVATTLFRFDAEGRPDPDFGIGGRVPSAAVFPGAGMWVEAMRVSATGRVLVAGELNRPDLDSDVFVSVLRPDGTLDPEFGAGGIAVADSGGDEWFTDAQWDGDAVVVLAETFSPFVVGALDTDAGFGLARFTRDGVLDDYFGAGGLASTATTGRASRAKFRIEFTARPDDAMLSTPAVCRGNLT